MSHQFNQPLVSVLTPTWNRGEYLLRVWEGLNSQSYTNIEWIVSNDGSSDETELIVAELAAHSSFPVTLINASVHIGKARMDNEAIAHARGEFILWNDSDDYLLPEAIERLVASWNSIPVERQEEFVGVTALCATEKGVISIGLPQEGQFDTTWNELTERLKITGDMLYLTRADALKKCPFPEVDFVIPEGVVWTTLGDQKIRFCPEVLKINEYRTPHCISFSGKMEYCRGRAYAMAISECNLQMFPRDLKVRWWRLITYIRCGLHGEIRLREVVRLWGANSSLLVFVLMLPAGYLLALKDRMQGKVRKTHRDFIAATGHATMSCVHFGDNLPCRSVRQINFSRTSVSLSAFDEEL